MGRIIKTLSDYTEGGVMIEYTYKEICEKCLILGHAYFCDNCNGVGYTESTSVDLPDNAYDIEVAK